MSARRQLGRARGFTLIELTVSLVAGLIVAMAVMGVSKEATNTFHEEVRVSAAEMGLRVAIERIRMDLARAAYMGTGNILGDPAVAIKVTPPAPASPTLSSYIGGAVPYSLNYLSGIALHPERSSVINPLDPAHVPPDLAARNQLQQVANQPAGAPGPLSPDSIDIAGNFSTSDEYAVKVVRGVAPPGNCSTAFALSVEMSTPAGWRLRNAETASAAAGNPNGLALQAAFHPGGGTATSFLLKFTDWTGKTQYLVGCAGGFGAGTSYNPIGGGNIPLAMIYLSTNSTILTNVDTGGAGGLTGYQAGIATVSPLEIVRWDIESQAQLAAQIGVAVQPPTYIYNATSLANVDASNFVLTRGYLDVSANCGNGSPCGVDPDTVEVVSEYAVDLKFGVTVDGYFNPACIAFPCPSTAPTYVANPFLNFRMDTLGNGAGNPYLAQVGIYNVNFGPQRIRDVQVRLGIRSAFADRVLDLYPPASSALSTAYLFRYQLDASSAHFNPGLPFARVRESTTEVALPNQTRFYW